MPESAGEKATKDLAAIKALKARFLDTLRNSMTAGDAEAAIALRKELQVAISKLKTEMAQSDPKYTPFILERIPFVQRINAAMSGFNAIGAIYEGQMLVPNPREYYERAKSDDVMKFGNYTMNPEMHVMALGKPFGRLAQSAIFIPDLGDFKGMTLAQTGDYLAHQRMTTHLLPGLEFMHWIVEEEKRIRQSLAPQRSKGLIEMFKNTEKFYFFGSLLCGPFGQWFVPYLQWNGIDFEIGDTILSAKWEEKNQVALLSRGY